MLGKPGRGGGRRFTFVTVALVVLLLAGAVLLQYSLDDSEVIQAGWDESSPFDTARSFLDVLGGIRETLAAHFWTKTDVVFHEYLGASLANEDALYPYYWMITRLDPHFVMPYFFASWMLCRFGLVDEGFNLALEGLRYNPDSGKLQENLASIYFFFKKDPEKARYHILKAIRLAPDEEQKSVYMTFLRIIDDVIAGKRTIPDVASLHQAEKIQGEHHHGEDEYCPECEREHEH